MRAPSTNGISFVMQSFIDELAVAAGQDPLQFRLDMLANPVPEADAGGGGFGGRFNGERAAGVVEAVRDMSNWDNVRTSLPDGRGMGGAFQFAHAGYFAWVVDLSVGENRRLTIHRAWCAGDIGRQIVNPSRAINLVEGGFIEALSHMMAWEITIEGGSVQQSNFPGVSAHSNVAGACGDRRPVPGDRFQPHWTGEPALPPAVPAVSNAIFDASGVRVRSLPLMKEGYGWT